MCLLKGGVMKNCWGLGTILFVLMCLASTAAFAEVVVIANKDVSETSMSKDKVKQIFLGKVVKWQDGSRIHFVTLKGDSHKDFLKEYIGRSEAQYKTYWKKILFTGKGSMPKSFDTEEEMAQYVANTAGAIGYVSTNAATENVATITVN
jgi:ABC-type phosphate transport system substrate-binding protein